MFNGKTKSENSKKGGDISPNALNLISNGSIIRGEVNAAGDMRVDGQIFGKIVSKAKIVIGETGKVEGNINCLNADISGHVNGDIYIGELLTLKSTARITGDIVTKKLVIEAGADFNGQCQMGEHAKGKQERTEHEPATRKIFQEA